MSGEVCDREHRSHPLVSYPDAVVQMVDTANSCAMPRDHIELFAARGRVLAEAVVMDRDEPPVPRSAMDGFALRAADGQKPRQVLQTVFAGSSELLEIGPGQACAVMTGGTIPGGADCVVPVEQTSVTAGQLHLEMAPQVGSHVRTAGEMGESGRCLLEPGQRLGAGDLAVAAGCGYRELEVFHQPSAFVLSTGDEVVPWAETPSLHQVRDSNRLGSLLQLEAAGAFLGGHQHANDNPEELRAATEAALAAHDLVVTIGGVSMGQKDYMPTVFEQLGVECLFHGVSIQPGKPVWVGQRENTWVLGLPGNPVSSAVILELFAPPLIAKLSAQREVIAPLRLRRGHCQGEARAKKRERFMPASVSFDGDRNALLMPRPQVGSGDWTSLAACNALLHIPAGSQYGPGDEVGWLPFSV